MEKGGGGGGGGQEYTKKISNSNTGNSSNQTGGTENCTEVNITTNITNPIAAMLQGIEEGSILQLNFSERLRRIEILNFEHNVCGYVTSSVDRLFACYDKGFRFEVALMRRNSDTSLEIQVRSKR